MTGWKTWVAVACVALLGALNALAAAGIISPELVKVADSVLGGLAGAFGLAGLGHKLDKGPVVPK